MSTIAIRLEHPEQTQPRAVLSHTTVAILSFTLLSMGIGSSLPDELGTLSLGAGLVGLLAFGVFESAARRRRRSTLEQLRTLLQHRLERNICNEFALAMRHPHIRPAERSFPCRHLAAE